jgi:hypothetical protein
MSATRIDTTSLDINNLFSQYFSGLKMYKTKDHNAYSVWNAKIYSVLGSYRRYVILITPIDDHPIGSIQPFEAMRWVSLQTRTISENYNIPEQSYSPARIPELNQKIIRDKGKRDVFLYYCPSLPSLEITLLQTHAKEEYLDTGNIISAIETFQTIFTFR